MPEANSEGMRAPKAIRKFTIIAQEDGAIQKGCLQENKNKRNGGSIWCAWTHQEIIYIFSRECEDELVKESQKGSQQQQRHVLTLKQNKNQVKKDNHKMLDSLVHNIYIKLCKYFLWCKN